MKAHQKPFLVGILACFIVICGLVIGGMLVSPVPEREISEEQYELLMQDKYNPCRDLIAANMVDGKLTRFEFSIVEDCSKRFIKWYHINSPYLGKKKAPKKDNLI